MNKVSRFTMTCGACPSQWEGTLDDGRMFYIRYRWGCLTLNVSDLPTDKVFDAIDGECLLDIEHGHGFDGVMSTNEMISLTNKVMDWSDLGGNNEDEADV